MYLLTNIIASYEMANNLPYVIGMTALIESLRIFKVDDVLEVVETNLDSRMNALIQALLKRIRSEADGLIEGTLWLSKLKDV